MQAGRKTLSANDVLQAMEEMEFPQFVDGLKECLDGKDALVLDTWILF